MKCFQRLSLGYRKVRKHKQCLSSNQYQLLEPRRFLSGDIGTVVANYRADFPIANQEPTAGWSYLWNAPAGWQPKSVPGNTLTGRLDHPTTSFKELQFAGLPNQWTADGDLNSKNSFPALSLSLNRLGGHTGSAGSSATGLAANSHDRFSIAAYTIAESGVYELTDSFIQSLSPNSDGLEFRVFVNHRANSFEGEIAGNGRAYFDTELGFLRKGDTIHVAAGAKNNSAFDNFRWNFSIVQHSNRLGRYGNFQSDLLKAPGSTNWSYLWNAPVDWTPNGSTGNLSTGAVGQPQYYQTLAKRTSSWNIPGSDGSRAPGFGLSFNANGGLPGAGYAANSAAKDRYVIAAYQVGVGGTYVINDSFLDVLDKRSDGVEVIVHVDNQSRINRVPIIARFSRGKTFDMPLGELSAGSTVYVAFGATNSSAFDAFDMDFSVDRVFTRELPLRFIRTPQRSVFQARDFGAIPNDGKNDWAAIDNAFAEMRKVKGPVELQLEPGTYDLQVTAELANRNSFFSLYSVSDWTINGRGATFLVDDYQRGLFVFQNSENVIAKNFTVDYATQTGSNFRPTTFTQGVIEQIGSDKKSFTLRVDTSKFLSPDGTFVTSSSTRGWGYAVDPLVPGRLKFNGDLGFGTTAVTKVDGDSFKIGIHHTRNLAVGDKYVLQRRVNYAMFGIYGGSRQVSLIGVTAYSSPSTFISSTQSEAINVIGSRVVIRPNSGRFKSANADGVHIQSSRVGAWVENSVFNGLSDDVMNFYTLPATILAQHSQTQFTMASINRNRLGSLWANAVKTGDQLKFVNPVTGTTIGVAKVTSSVVTKTKSDNSSELIDTLRVTVDQPIRGVIVGRAPAGDVAGYRTETTVFNEDLSRSFVVQGNTLSNSRRYGLFLMANHVEVTNNNFIGLSDQAINGANETNWPLGLHPSNITIQGNRFFANGFSNKFLTAPHVTATIDFRMDRYVDALVNRHVYELSNIRIVNNRIGAWQNGAISVRNTEGATIENNRILAPRGLSNGAVAINVDWTKSTRLIGNTDLTTSVLYGNRINNVGLRYS